MRSDRTLAADTACMYNTDQIWFENQSSKFTQQVPHCPWLRMVLMLLQLGHLVRASKLSGMIVTPRWRWSTCCFGRFLMADSESSITLFGGISNFLFLGLKNSGVNYGSIATEKCIHSGRRADQNEKSNSKQLRHIFGDQKMNKMSRMVHEPCSG